MKNNNLSHSLIWCQSETNIRDKICNVLDKVNAVKLFL